MKIRMLQFAHFVGGTIAGAQHEDEDKDQTFSQFIEQSRENELLEIHYELDSNDKHHIVVFYSRLSK